MNGKREGEGTLTVKETGNIYKGEFKNNTPNGKGVLTVPDEMRYEGIFTPSQAN